MKTATIAGVLIILACFLGSHSYVSIAYASNQTVVIASKKFTESVILGDIVTELLRSKEIPVEHKKEIGLSQILWKALLRGDIDAYPEYTGTIVRELLNRPELKTLSDIETYLKIHFQLGMTKPLGFSNSFALGISDKLFRSKKLLKISDIARLPSLKFGLSHEFIDRHEGWPSLKLKYKLHPDRVMGIEHELAYRALQHDMIDVTDLYSTDADIQFYKIHILEDDLRNFPSYEAIVLYRLDLVQRFPQAVESFKNLEGKISQSQMIALNKGVKIDRKTETQMAYEFIRENLVPDWRPSVLSESLELIKEMGMRTYEHLYLVGVSLFFAILMGLPLGVIAAKFPRFSGPILGTAGTIQTVPSLALLVFMIPVFGIGSKPSIVALFLYSLLPIVRNTFSGIKDIPGSIGDSATGLGLTSWQKLRIIEIPMAYRSIFGGIKTSAVINIGSATLGALIGAGGFGQPILVGIRRDDVSMILQGAIPAALLAILVQLLFDRAERRFLP